jgi:hypothetical protein
MVIDSLLHSKELITLSIVVAIQSLAFQIIDSLSIVSIYCPDMIEGFQFFVFIANLFTFTHSPLVCSIAFCNTQALFLNVSNLTLFQYSL